jgi:RNA polymerase sigma factor (sigma-70 family)
MGEVGDLVARARDGDRDAWNALVARYARLVLAVARLHGVREADREDIAQVTWLKLAQHLDRLQNPDAVGAWLATTCRNESLRLLGKAAREIPTDDEAFDRIVDPDDLDEQVARRMPNRELWSAFARLSASCQLLLRLLILEEPYPEIAKVMGKPIGWIGPTRGRCLEKLRKLLPDDARITMLSGGS